MSISEKACVYASLILEDDGVEITNDKLATLCKAANVDVEPIWFSLFAKALKGKDLKELLFNVGSGGGGGGAPAAGGDAGAATGGAAPAAKKEEAKEESDEDMGFGLFD